jgi:hypothetical protein
MKRVKNRGFLLLLAAFAAITGTVYASEDTDTTGYVKGYVILLNGDTLQGSIVWRNKYVEKNPVEISFTPVQGTTRIYSASQLVGFGNHRQTLQTGKDETLTLDAEYYASMPSIKNGVPVFMNRLSSGRITVYRNHSTRWNGPRVEARKEMNGIDIDHVAGQGLIITRSYKTNYRVIEGRQTANCYFASKDGGDLVTVTRKNYESLFPLLFGGCAGIYQEIKDNPELKDFNNFVILAEMYDQMCE